MQERMTDAQYQQLLKELRSKRNKTISDEKTIRAVEQLLHHREHLQKTKW